MKAELMISELCLDIDKETGKKYIYPSLIDFYADTKEDHEELINTMLESGLFDFTNTGKYEGIDNRTNRHWTYDEGKPSVQWLICLIRNINFMNYGENDITIKISKEYLLDNEAVIDLASEDREDTEELMEELIDLYVYHLKALLKRRKCGDWLKTDTEGKLSKNIKSGIGRQVIYIK